MTRRFNKTQKLVLALLAGFRCESCGVELPKDFHGDHRVAWSKGGETTVANGQALCARCNLAKGNR